MKLYEITIQPTSGFGTPLKGDTLFGHFCWQAAYDASLLNGGLEKWIDCYAEKPFAVFSSAWAKFCQGKTVYALKRPDLPLSVLFRAQAGDKKTQITKRKENMRKKWMLVGKDLSLVLDSVEYLTDEDLTTKANSVLTAETRRQMRGKHHLPFICKFSQPHNTINRLTMTTGTGMFAPFAETSIFYYPETELVIFVLIEEEATDIDRVKTALDRIGQWGYGRNASSGQGRFNMAEHDELSLPSADSPNACYVLAATVPEKGVFSDYYFTPFVRFGRHGDMLARSRNPFKNPVVMADEGAVFVTEDSRVFKKPYIGTAVRNTSKAMPQTVAQGYSLYLPFRLETQYERDI